MCLQETISQAPLILQCWRYKRQPTSALRRDRSAFPSVPLLWYTLTMSDSQNAQPSRTPKQGAYFASPAQAVDAIRELLRDEDWATLASYYDLGGTNIDRATLLSGAFFVRNERPEAAHPGGFWRFKQPFPPSFQFAFASPADAAGVVTVEVSITIDQGGGEPVQEGRQQFRMRQSAQGFQILPD